MNGYFSPRSLCHYCCLPDRGCCQATLDLSCCMAATSTEQTTSSSRSDAIASSPDAPGMVWDAGSSIIGSGPGDTPIYSGRSPFSIPRNAAGRYVLGVVLGSLVIQGLTLAPLVRWLGLNQQDETSVEQEAHVRLELVTSALTYLEQHSEQMKEYPETIGRIRAHFERHGELAISQLTMLSLPQDEALAISPGPVENSIWVPYVPSGGSSSDCVIKAKSKAHYGSG